MCSVAASTRSVSRAKCRCSPRLARYRPSSPSINSSMSCGLVSMAGTATSVRYSTGIPCCRLSRGSGCGRTTMEATQFTKLTPICEAQKPSGTAIKPSMPSASGSALVDSQKPMATAAVARSTAAAYPPSVTRPSPLAQAAQGVQRIPKACSSRLRPRSTR